MDTWLQLALTSIASVLASSGFWAFMQHKDERRNATTRLLMGLAYDQITTRGIAYIDRGWITKDEYEEYRKYFFEPYQALGGNGTAGRIMDGVTKLPFRRHSKHDELFNNEGSNNVRVVARSSGQDSHAE